MRIACRVVVIALTVLFIMALGASAQMGMRAPQIPGVWNLVVGSGAAYDQETKEEHGLQKSHLEMAIVDKEIVDGSSDVWISDKVAPWGLVKKVGKDRNLPLTRLITGAKGHITGTPQQFDPMEMMRQRGKP